MQSLHDLKGLLRKVERRLRRAEAAADTWFGRPASRDHRAERRARNAAAVAQEALEARRDLLRAMILKEEMRA